MSAPTVPRTSTDQVTADEFPPNLQPGDFHPPVKGSIRGACPIVNSMANHGYIPRDGRNVTPDHFRTAFKALGIGYGITEGLIYGSYLEHEHDGEGNLVQPPNKTKGKSTAKDASATESTPLIHGHDHDHDHDHDHSHSASSHTEPGPSTSSPSSSPQPKQPVPPGCGHGGGPFSGLRPKGQVNTMGTPVLHLDQIGRHGAVEHDVSLSRRDWAQGDNSSPQPDLIQALIDCSSDKKVITTSDLGRFRKERYAQAKRENPHLKFGQQEESMACGEAAFLQAAFGRGWCWWSLPVDYVRALFVEERLPVREGWVKRRWFPVSILELGLLMQIMKRYAWVDLPKEKTT